MAKYASYTDAVDPALSNLDERHLLKADVYVDGKLRDLGIDPGTVTLPNPQLTEVAAAWALRMAAIEGAVGADSPLTQKIEQYGRTAELLAKSVSRESLGLARPAGTGFGFVSLGRG